MSNISLKFSKHFKDIFLEDDFDILLMVGGYGSGKSFTGFLKTILLGSMEKRRMLIVRKVYATIKDSCFEDCKEAISTLGLEREWSDKKSPYELRNKITGTQIIFKGVDDWRKLKSIKNIDFIVIEEADELSIEDIKELRKRLRVRNIRCKIILMCNPISRNSSIYTMFFTENGYNFNEEELYRKRRLELVDTVKINDKYLTQKVIVHHSTYRDNPHLSEAFIYELESEKDPNIKRIATEGKFGADGYLVLNNQCFENNVYEKYVKDKIHRRDIFYGLDFGHSISYTCGVKMAVNRALNELYVFWEYYDKGRTTLELMEGLSPMKELNIRIGADCAASQTIDDMYDFGFNIYGAKKGKGSVEYHEQLLRSFSRIVIDIKHCPRTKEEIENLIYKKDRAGNISAGEYNIDAHSMDAMSYGLDDYDFVPLKERIKRKKKYIGI